MADKFTKQLEKLNIELNEKQREQFHRYYELLVEWNKVMNLTGITEYDEVNEKHFVDSLAVAKVIDLKKNRHSVGYWNWSRFSGITFEDCISSFKCGFNGFITKAYKLLKHSC